MMRISSNASQRSSMWARMRGSWQWDRRRIDDLLHVAPAAFEVPPR